MVNGIQLTIYHSQFTIFSSMQLQPYLNFMGTQKVGLGTLPAQPSWWIPHPMPFSHNETKNFEYNKIKSMMKENV